MIPFSFIKSAPGNTWAYPLSTNGVTDLLVPSGNTTYLDPGQVYSYNSITVDAGGTLVINQTLTAAWTTLAAKTSFVVNGTIVAQQGLFAGGTATLSAIDGKNLSATTSQANGGAGYFGRPEPFYSASGSVGGAQFLGNGGGGGAGGNAYYQSGPGGDATQYQGGHAGWYTTSYNVGGYRAGNNGTSGTRSGEGGGGGAAGAHGLFLYLASGVQITGTGTINVSGSSGGNGGNGGPRNQTGSVNNTGYGGGGGGGAGGSGGHIRYYSATGIAGSVVLNVAGGTHGNGGVNGQSEVAANGINGSNGTIVGV